LRRKVIVIGDCRNKHRRDNDMRILHINSYYSVSKFYKNLYDKQVKSGLDIDVFVPVSSIFENNEFDYGEYTTISRNHNKYDRVLFHLKHYKIYKCIQESYNIKDYSLIHAHSLFSNGFIALRLKKQYGIPYIVAVRNTDINVFFKKMIHLRNLGIEILKEAQQIIFLSKSYRDQMIEKYIPKHLQKIIDNKVSIIPNGIDDFWFNNMGLPKQKLQIPDLRLLQVGDINKNKNIETTVKAIDILVKKGYKVKLDVVGKVKDQNIFNNLKSLDYVNYLGYKSKEELIKIYRQNDIFVLPSITETFGLVYAEAMSQGLPVIYSKGQGFDGQFEDGEVGFKVDSYDSLEIAKKIIETLKSYEIISENCVNKCIKYNWEINTKDYEKIYTSIYRK